jgi:hypothetical protein
LLASDAQLLFRNLSSNAGTCIINSKDWRKQMMNKKHRWVLSLTVVVFVSQLVSAAERREISNFVELGAPSEESRQAVGELVEAFKKSWASQGVESHIGLFAADAEWINAYARMFRGKRELAVFLEDRLFPNFDPSVSKEEMANSRSISIRHLSDTAAVIHMATDGRRGDSAVPEELMRRTHIHLIVEKQQGGWLIVRTAIMDARV